MLKSALNMSEEKFFGTSRASQVMEKPVNVESFYPHFRYILKEQFWF